jgi:hypothetical protein
MPVTVVNGELVGGEIQVDPCPGAKRKLILKNELTVDEWNAWAAKVLAECHKPQLYDFRPVAEPTAATVEIER